MKWYYIGLLSLLVCTLTGLLGWYIGGLENKFWPSAAVAIVCVALSVISFSRDFRRKFPDFAAYTVLCFFSVVIYAAAAIINHHRHLPHNLPLIE